ncbi:hypothetical protein GCM10009555_084210 [Acrocarpospora macrocephala]|uniref:Uncharacterized protein n=1 Tax=Acrocarpospora macrocephala TaxID=150177 RepID=A0A5M3WYP2_9ACTN|nr:hypothetical protein [Acrocarpospora macrocephala]GES13536.1 hypothetical protein Amac_071330 [Acrocarpospora macrocephala]
MRRFFVIFGSMAIVAAMAVPAYAGNWAVTELDPLPDRIEADQAYTVGYWVLQHGTHPFEGSEKQLGETGLRLTDEKGTVLTFTGSRLPEPAHYAVAVKIPQGTWRVQGIQGIFMEHEVGTLTVPGTLTLAPPQFPALDGAQVKDYWGEIKPPGFPWKGEVTGQSPPTSQAVAAQPTPQATNAALTQPKEEASATTPIYLLALVALLSIAGTLVVQRLRPRRRPPLEEPDPTLEDIVVIGGTKHS